MLEWRIWDLTWADMGEAAWRAFLWAVAFRLINGRTGWVPGIVWGTVVEGLDAMAAACQDLWRAGAQGETLNFRRL